MTDISSSERDFIGDIHYESREIFFRRRNIIMQDITDNEDPDCADNYILECKSINRSLTLRTSSTQQALRMTKKDGNSRPWLMTITSSSSQMTTATPEAFRVNRRWLPTGIHVHPDRPHNATINYKSKLKLSDFLTVKNKEKTWKSQRLPN